MRFAGLHSRFSAALFSSLALSGFSFAEIQYSIRATAEGGQLELKLVVPVKSAKEVFESPNWAPGAYILSDNGKSLTDVEARDENGRLLPITHPQHWQWQVDAAGAKQVVFKYKVPFSRWKDGGHIYGPASYVYVAGRKEEKCKLEVFLPEGWRTACGLNNVGGSPFKFTAPDYDVLADNSLTVGNFLEDHYTVRGKDHTIALYGSAEKVDRKVLLEKCKKITDTQANFFGGLPYEKYVWHFSVFDSPDGGGGLEHLSSTEISLSSGLGPGITGVLSHEFFHLWNVKRIRSKVLGPFDYIGTPKTKALWWLEGVTDYYADLFLSQNSMATKDRFWNNAVNHILSVRGNPAFNEIGPAESSNRVWEAAEGRGNSNGYKISYYELGWIAGLCLDLELRSRTGGKRSLNDVEWALFELCRDNKPGFEEGEIRNQLVKFGGAEMGAYYDQMIEAPGLPSLEASLAKAGLTLVTGPEKVEIYEISLRPTPDGKNWNVRRSNLPALKGGDVIVSINDEPVEGKTYKEVSTLFETLMKRKENGGACTVIVRRADKQVFVRIPPREERIITRTRLVEDQDKAHAALRKALLTLVARG